jgi:hypothetical protein
VEEISAARAAELGVTAQHGKTDNGEMRYRLQAKDGTGYERVEASLIGAWQDSHYYESALETYILQEGWAAFVESHGGDLRVWIMRPGDLLTARPGVPHNVYLAGQAVAHVVKHGGSGDSTGWIADPALDALTKHLSEAEILSW